MTRMFFILLLVSFFVFDVLLFSKKTRTREPKGGPVIVSSIYPLYEFAREVGGTYATNRLVTPSGVEPHEYEPTPQDILAISTSDLFLYISPRLESWATKAAATFTSSDKPLILETGSIAALENNDPHIWLDPVKAIEIVTAIKNSLISIDQTHKNEYETNAISYIAKLKTLDREYKSLSICPRKDIVTTHNAFGYLAKRYGFAMHPIAGFSPENEPSAQKLAEITSLVKEKQIQYIFYETLAANTMAETITRETAARTLLFNPIEGLTIEEKKQNKTYIDIQYDNIKNLKLALACQ